VTTKDETTRREQEAWAELEAAVAAVPEERLETPALDGGWSVKDVLWHIAYWWNDFVRASADGWSEDPGETDDVNDREFRRSRALPYVEVRAMVDEAREGMLEVWSRVAEDDAEGVSWFVEETIDHYPDHLQPIRSLVEDPNVKARGA